MFASVNKCHAANEREEGKEPNTETPYRTIAASLRPALPYGATMLVVRTESLPRALHARHLVPILRKCCTGHSFRDNSNAGSKRTAIIMHRSALTFFLWDDKGTRGVLLWINQHNTSLWKAAQLPGCVEYRA